MGDQTKIEWTEATFNPWWGCAHVSPGCANCYAETMAARYGHDVWGKDGARRTFGDKHWAEPLKWNRRAEERGRPMLVFCASMADVFEPHPALPPERERLWHLIEATPHLRWQLLTKRPELVKEMVPSSWTPETFGGFPSNVWIGTSVEDQQRADERIAALVDIPAPIRFLSCEPLLAPVDLREWLRAPGIDSWIDWVIVGGESGTKARPMHPEWARLIREQCLEAGVPFLFKQWGEWAPNARDGGAEWRVVKESSRRSSPKCIRLKPDGEIVTVINPPIEEWLSGTTLARIGKAKAGRLLDGRTWDGLPPVEPSQISLEI